MTLQETVREMSKLRWHLTKVENNRAVFEKQVRKTRQTLCIIIHDDGYQIESIQSKFKVVLETSRRWIPTILKILFWFIRSK